MEQEKKSKSTSEKILSTAYRLLSLNGYANVSMRNIADEADVALSQITYHYRSKEGLLVAVVDHVVHKYVDGMEFLISGKESPKELMRAVLDYYKGLLSANKELTRLLVDFTAQAIWVPSFKKHVHSLFERTALILEKCVHGYEGQAHLFEHYSVKAVARYLFGTLYGIAASQAILEEDDESVAESLQISGYLLDMDNEKDQRNQQDHIDQ